MTVRTSHAWLGLAVTDRVFVDTPLLALYGSPLVPYEIVGITDRGDARVLALLEGDPLTREVPLAGTLAYAGLRTLPLAGTLDAVITGASSRSPARSSSAARLTCRSPAFASRSRR